MTDSEHHTLRRFLGEAKAKAPDLKLLYRGSRDGFTAADFHRHCDGKGPTLTVVHTSQGWVFGGYASVSWSSKESYVSAPGSFLFTLRNSSNLPPQLFSLEHPQFAMACNSHYGPTFGRGYDLRLAAQPNANSNSYSELGQSYALPAGRTVYLLAGARNFTVSELEVFGRRSACFSQCWSECSSFVVDCSCFVGGTRLSSFCETLHSNFTLLFFLTSQLFLPHIGLQFRSCVSLISLFAALLCRCRRSQRSAPLRAARTLRASFLLSSPLPPAPHPTPLPPSTSCSLFCILPLASRFSSLMDSDYGFADAVGSAHRCYFLVTASAHFVAVCHLWVCAVL